MGKQLIIAEKPSVANDIARALGGFARHQDYYESEHYVLSSAVGHLLELAAPEQCEVKRGKWSFAHLPVIPPHFDLKPIEKTEARLKLLSRLMRRKEVAGLINACDAGREGELIFHYIVRHTASNKPVKRLWLQSMTPEAIREGFAHLKTGEAMAPLTDAAVCRSESDWLVGINGTRAMTAFNSKTGGFQLTTVGRVQTPTLAILVEREERIRKFIPRNYWELSVTFAVEAGEYSGRWFDENFSKSENDSELKPERIWDYSRALALKEKCEGKLGEVSEESKPTSQLSPLLYDLTSLQRESNSRFGFSAKTTLALAQALYEKHKVLTYPRTDSKALPEDYPDMVRQTLTSLAEAKYRPFAETILRSNWVRPNKRVFNNTKVSDHFAIIPTSLAPKHLSEAEDKLYDLITKRFLAVFYPAAEFLVTTRITRLEHEPFKTEGKVMMNPGWLAVYGKEASLDDVPKLVAVKAGERAHMVRLDLGGYQTKPPARFTEATLLSAMEGAGRLVEDEDLREAMRGKGLGTPATRSQIIEGLIQEKYVHRSGRELEPTAKAFSLMALLHGLGIPELTSSELTGEWEYKLARIERGELKRFEFMKEIGTMTRHIVEQAMRHESDTVPGEFSTLAVACPKCGGIVKENYKKFQCQGCDFSLWRIAAGRQLDVSEVEELIAVGTVGPLAGFRSRAGKPFTASIRLKPDFSTEFVFGDSADGSLSGEAPDFSDREPLGNCPKCRARVFEYGQAYVCERSLGETKSCDFRMGKAILKRPLEPAQASKLLASGKSDLLHKFISKKGRPFSAYLVVGESGSVGFEFPIRESKTNQDAKAKRKTGKSGE
jgi:DNA topoisomerase-3